MSTDEKGGPVVIADDDIQPGVRATIKLRKKVVNYGLTALEDRAATVLDVLRNDAFGKPVGGVGRVLRVDVRDETTGAIHRFYRRPATSTLHLFDPDGRFQWVAVAEEWFDPLDPEGLVLGAWPELRDAE